MELHSNDGNPLGKIKKILSFIQSIAHRRHCVTDEPAYHYQYITCPNYSTDPHANSLIEQAYILQSYPESENYASAELINPDAELQPHYQIGSYIQQTNNIEYEVTDPGPTQIILHVDGSNGGQFYQQVHNVHYVNDNQTASTYHHYTMEAADIDKQENELIHVIPNVNAHDSYEYSMLNSMNEHIPAGHALPSNDHELMHEKEQQRILLESTMSPLCKYDDV